MISIEIKFDLILDVSSRLALGLVQLNFRVLTK